MDTQRKKADNDEREREVYYVGRYEIMNLSASHLDVHFTQLSRAISDATSDASDDNVRVQVSNIIAQPLQPVLLYLVLVLVLELYVSTFCRY